MGSFCSGGTKKRDDNKYKKNGSRFEGDGGGTSGMVILTGDDAAGTETITSDGTHGNTGHHHHHPHGTHDTTGHHHHHGTHDTGHHHHGGDFSGGGGAFGGSGC